MAVALGLALALGALNPDAAAGVGGPRLTLDLHPCAAVDEAAVRALIELELPEARAPRPEPPIAVTVRCVGGTEEIRVLPRTATTEGASRTLTLAATSEVGRAAQQARSRELALAIAELIRRLEITRPPDNETRPPEAAPAPAASPEVPATAPAPAAVPPPAPPPTLTASAPPPASPTQPSDGGSEPWQLGVQSAYESFGGGQHLTGADISVGRQAGRWLLGELLVGGRLGDGERLPSGQPAISAAAAAAGVGLNLTSPNRAVGGALLLRAQAYAVEYSIDHPDGSTQGAWFGALFVALEPRLVVKVARHVALTATAGAGFPVRGVVVRTQGARTDSLSGLALSARLGALLTF